MTNNKLYFSNPGEIDIRAVTTLGVNVKQGDNPIGHFGTGLKYAIAGILRLGGNISIWSGIEEYKFGFRKDLIRGKEFQIVTMEEVPGDPASLGFTTDLGKDWEPWMIYRELRSNMLDEDGELFTGDEPETGKTMIEVDCQAIWDAHMNRGTFWLESTPIWEGHGLAIHDGQSPTLFYHNIRATDHNSGKTANWAWVYNITAQLKLTEDRTLGNFYDARTLIAKALARCDNVEVLERVLGNDAECDAFDFDHWDISASAEFVQVVLGRIERKLKVPSSARDLVKRHNPDVLEQAELDIPSDWDEMERRAPEEAPEVKAYKYEWIVEVEGRIEGLEAELKYWKACARKLETRQHEAPEAGADE